VIAAMGWITPTAPRRSRLYQSTVTFSPGMKVGVSTAPSVLV
jgi:hypothetical protein